MGIFAITIISLPLLAAAVLALYALALIPLRAIPAHEYTQAVRAPIWLVVLVSGSLLPLALYALLQAAPVSAPTFIGWPRTGPVLLADAYALWACAVLGAIVAAAAWVPAARRSLGARSAGPSLLLLLLLFAALLLLFGLRLPLLQGAWFVLLGGTALLWLMVGRPRRQWVEWEPLAVLGLAALFGGLGLGWLDSLVRAGLLTDAWSQLLTVSPRATSGAMLCIMLGWLGPAVYLPWWLWRRRDEPAQAWLPAALLVAVTGPLALIRLFCFTFPVLDTAVLRTLHVENLFHSRSLLIWLQVWAFLALVLGAGWLVHRLWRRQRDVVEALRSLPLAVAGLMLLGLAMGLQTQTTVGVTGMLWLLLAWAGGMTICLTAGNLLDALMPGEVAERQVLVASTWVGLAWLVGCPPGPAFWGIFAGWGSLAAIGAPRPVVLLALAVLALCAGALLPRWLRSRYATVAYPGAGWGILAPFALAFLLLLAGLLAGRLAPVFAVIHRSLLQTY